MKVKITGKGDTRIFTGVESLTMVKQDGLFSRADMHFGYVESITCLERGPGGYVGSISMETPDGTLGMGLDVCEKIEVSEEAEA